VFGTVATTKEEPEPTVIVVAEDVIGADSVVCCERDEYFLVVIQVPIGVRNELVVGSFVVALLSLH
jgi:hypothetical protein